MILRHRARDKMAAILQTTFSHAFSWMKIYKFRLRFRWSLFLGVQLTIFHYLNLWWLVYCRVYTSQGRQWVKRPPKCIPAAVPCYSSVGFSISVLDEVSPVQGPLKVISKLSGDGVNDILARLVVPRSLGNQFRLTIKLTQLSTSGWGTTAYSKALTQG